MTVEPTSRRKVLADLARAEHQEGLYKIPDDFNAESSPSYIAAAVETERERCLNIGNSLLNSPTQGEQDDSASSDDDPGRCGGALCPR